MLSGGGLNPGGFFDRCWEVPFNLKVVWSARQQRVYTAMKWIVMIMRACERSMVVLIEIPSRGIFLIAANKKGVGLKWLPQCPLCWHRQRSTSLLRSQGPYRPRHECHRSTLRRLGIQAATAYLHVSCLGTTRRLPARRHTGETLTRVVHLHKRSTGRACGSLEIRRSCYSRYNCRRSMTLWSRHHGRFAFSFVCKVVQRQRMACLRRRACSQATAHMNRQ